MEKLKELKKEMLDAEEALETFMINNSRELKEDEKRNEAQFTGGEESQRMVFELTKDNIDEMRKLEQNKKETYSAYMNIQNKEY